jgi:hypothetical protein
MDEAPTRGLVVDVLQARDVWLTLDADLTRSYEVHAEGFPLRPRDNFESDPHTLRATCKIQRGLCFPAV